MGKELRILCDGCGSDCTHNYYTLTITHHIYSESNYSEVLESDYSKDTPYLCENCFKQIFSAIASVIHDVVWSVETEDLSEF